MCVCVCVCVCVCACPVSASLCSVLDATITASRPPQRITDQEYPERAEQLGSLEHVVAQPTAPMASPPQYELGTILQESFNPLGLPGYPPIEPHVLSQPPA